MKPILSLTITTIITYKINKTHNTWKLVEMVQLDSDPKEKLLSMGLLALHDAFPFFAAQEMKILTCGKFNKTENSHNGTSCSVGIYSLPQ